ncbi:putative Ig domain-containing protein [Lentisalinibacter salinarum]|uniref:putative Ig domain-containing protein n=1 Tax=Lentisalinibacter salinarum TaxID=2992239 RepID=UPI00386CF6A9
MRLYSAPAILNRLLILPVMSLALSGCLMEEEVAEQPIANDPGGATGEILRDHELSGSVGDGPIIGAAVRIVAADGTELGGMTSDASAGYNITVRTKGKHYPLSIDAQGGTDLVTGLAPDFVLKSVALEPGKKTVSNLNPFSTLAAELAAELPGGLTKENLAIALNRVTTKLNSGLVTLTGEPVMTQALDAATIAEMVKASETLGETIRRTRDSLVAVGRQVDGDAVVAAIASDLTDGKLDGAGGAKADARIAAVATVAATQTLLEAIANRLQVNGVDAMGPMDDSIRQVMPDAAGATTTEVPVSAAALEQVRIGLAAAKAVMPAPEFDDLEAVLSGFDPGISPKQIEGIVPRESVELLDNTIIAVADGSQDELDTVNGTTRNDGDTPSTNSPPTISGDPPTVVTEGERYSFAPTVSDPDGDALIFEIANRPAWASFDAGTGELFGTPGAGDAGSYADITITVSDGAATASLGPFTVEVRQLVTNSAPTIGGSPPATVSEGASYSFMPSASDADGDSLTFDIVNMPAWSSFDTATGRLFGTPAAGDAGVYGDITITVTDGEAQAALGPFAIEVRAVVSNSAPVISGSPATSVDEGTAYEFTPSASDADGDALVFDIANMPSWASFDTSTGRLAGTPATGDSGTYGNIAISVSDGQDSASLPAFTITVQAMATNSAPVISGSPAKAVTEGTQYSFTPSASDPDGDSLSFSITNKPAWAAFDAATGRLSGTPQAGDVGTYADIVISVSDGQASASLGAFSITVEAIAMGSVTLSWSPPTENTDGTALTDLAGYRIYWGTTSGSYPNSVTIDNPGVTTYVVENLVPDTYEFVATSYNTSGVESDYSAPATKTVQ